MSGDDRILPPSALVAGALLAALFIGCGDSGETTGSDQFRDQTNSALLDFGAEGGSAELDEATDAVDEFLEARSSEDWEGVCAQLSRVMIDRLENLATRSTGLSDASCASFLEAFTQISAQQLKETGVDGGSLRQAGKQGYLIYSGPDEVVHAMEMSKEGGEWRVAAITAKPLG